MGLVELLEQIRTDFIDQFLAAIKEKKASEGVRVVSEPSLRDDEGSLAFEGEWQLPVRVDIAILQNDELSDMLNVEPKTIVAFDPVEFDWSKTLHVEMGPFAWQAFSIKMPNEPHYDWDPVQAWFWKWFQDDEDVDDPDTPMFLGAVHYLSDPVVLDDVVEMTFDLGTAPIAAFEELLDVFVATGVTLCAIGDVPGVKSDS